jgi:glyoxylase-like metal-dependent hydrolase (beta-lactamase superfamily II)
MKPILPALLLLFFWAVQSHELLGQSWKTKIKPSANFTIQQLAPRVWVAIHNDFYGKAICNAGIVDLGDKALVFDPFMTPSAAVELKEIAKKLTKKKVSIVVNSHYHNDHIRGNQVFVPNATIITTNTTKEQIQRNEPGEQEWEKKHAPTLLQAIRKRMVNASEVERDEMPYWVGYYEGILESSDQLFTALADYTFDDSLWITGTKLSVKLVECKNGHTVSDAVLLIPTLGIAFMGDLLCTERHPWLSDSDVDGWRNSLKIFYEDTLYNTYLPGHGKVSSKPALKTLYEYLGDVQQLCDNAQSDSAQSALMNQPIPVPYKSWFCARFYQPNLQYLISIAKAKKQASLRSEKSSNVP